MEKVLHPFKTTGRITGPYVLVLVSLVKQVGEM
jgi:hypothetical protein